VLIFGLFCYLGLYTWNARTGYLDTIAERSGLEIVGHVLTPVVWVRDSVVESWNNYLALIGIAEENAFLRAELMQMKKAATLGAEEREELTRLRKLLLVAPLREAPGFAARVIATRFGPHSPLHTITVNKGFADGATVGTPVVVPDAVVGRVLRASPHAATVLLLTDPGFRVAVISQTTRTPGIAGGMAGDSDTLELSYVAQNARIRPGEVLVTAGVDGVFPKGIPVGVVTSVQPGNETLFLRVHAHPLVDREALEEVVLLMPQGSGEPVLPPLVGPPEPVFREDSHDLAPR